MQQPMSYPNQNAMFAGQQGQQMPQQQNVGQQWGYGQQPNQQQMMAQQNMQNAQQQGYYPQQMGQQGIVYLFIYFFSESYSAISHMTFCGNKIKELTEKSACNT